MQSKEEDDQFEISLLGQLNPVLFSPQQQNQHKKLLKQYWSPHEKFLEHNQRTEDPNATAQLFGPTAENSPPGDTQAIMTRSENVDVNHASQ